MQITLKCKYSSGSVGFAAGRIEGLPVEARKYAIENGLLTISGEDHIVHHDVDELLASNIYQMPTPAEQKKMAQEAQQASQAQESAPADPPALDNEQASDPPALDEPIDPPASKKKASGG